MEGYVWQMTTRINFIYGLYNEIGECRYVGITCHTLKQRLAEHINGAKRGNKTYCAAWIRSMKVLPRIGLIEQTIDRSREIYWIRKYREAGYKLTNLTDGGDGTLGFVMTAETRAKISLSNLGRIVSIEQRLLISLRQKGRKGTPHTEATRLRLSQIRMGKTTGLKQRVAVAQSNKNRVWTEEQKQNLSNRCKIAWARRKATYRRSNA